jgi:hypothetical protein
MGTAAASASSSEPSTAPASRRDAAFEFEDEHTTASAAVDADDDAAADDGGGDDAGKIVDDNAIGDAAASVGSRCSGDDIEADVPSFGGSKTFSVDGAAAVGIDDVVDNEDSAATAPILFTVMLHPLSKSSPNLAPKP